MSNHDYPWCRKHVGHSAVTMCGITLFVGMMAGPVLAQSGAATVTTSGTTPGGAALRFALPAEPLAETLRAIGEQSGQSIQFNPADVQGIQAPAIQGEYTPEAAIQKAVADSKVTMSSSPGGGWAVFVPQRLGTVNVTANIDEAETGFQATHSDTATRSGSNLMDVPQSMTVITSDVMQSQQALNITDVLQDVSGVQVQAATQGTTTFNVRGLTVASLTNGLANPFATSTNVAGVERIEVLQGPQAILAGGDSLGGGVNIVTKKPSADPIANLTLQDGTYGDKTATADFSGALADDGKLSGRVIGSWTRAADSDAGYDGRRENYFMPEIRWKDDRADFTAGVSYDKEFDPFGRYTFAPQNSILPVPSMRLGPGNNGNEVKTRSIFYSLEYKVAPWLTWVSRFHRDLTDQHLSIWGAQFPLDAQGSTWMYSPTDNPTRYETTSTDNYLRFSLNTGPLEHVLSTGVNITLMNYTQYEYSLPDLYPIDVYSGQLFDFPPVYHVPANLYSIDMIKEEQYGEYAQDLITWGDFHALLNIRRTHYETGPDSTIFTQYNHVYSTPEKSIDKTTPGVGLVYDVTPNVSVYGAYSEGFAPDFSTTKICGSEEAIPPLSSRNQELGIKMSSSNGLFSLTSSVFNLYEKNVLDYDAALNCENLISGQRTRGMEVDAQGQLAEGWNLIANFTRSLYTNEGGPGLLIAGEPNNQVSVWTTYDFPKGPLHGFGVGGGMTAYSRSYTYFEPGYPEEPGGARVDLSAYYHWQKQWSFILGVKNVFDRTLYGVASTFVYIPVDPRRTVMFTVKYSLL